SGFLALRALGLADMPAPAAWVAGVFSSALAVYALVAWFKLLALTAFALWASALVACAIAFRERDPAPARLDRQELAGLALCVLATALWCRDIAQAPMRLERDGVLFRWVDTLIYGGLISHFGHWFAYRLFMFFTTLLRR